MAACVERRAACGASYNACASGATPCAPPSKRGGGPPPPRPPGGYPQALGSVKDRALYDSSFYKGGIVRPLRPLIGDERVRCLWQPNRRATERSARRLPPVLTEY